VPRSRRAIFCTRRRPRPAIIPIGYPLGKFGPVRRGLLASVVYKDRWGQAWNGDAMLSRS
jgi:hypothetical protein